MWVVQFRLIGESQIRSEQIPGCFNLGKPIVEEIIKSRDYFKLFSPYQWNRRFAWIPVRNILAWELVTADMGNYDYDSPLKEEEKVLKVREVDRR